MFKHCQKLFGRNGTGSFLRYRVGFPHPTQLSFGILLSDNESGSERPSWCGGLLVENVLPCEGNVFLSYKWNIYYKLLMGKEWKSQGFGNSPFGREQGDTKKRCHSHFWPILVSLKFTACWMLGYFILVHMRLVIFHNNSEMFGDSLQFFNSKMLESHTREIGLEGTKAYWHAPMRDSTTSWDLHTKTFIFTQPKTEFDQRRCLHSW